MNLNVEHLDTNGNYNNLNIPISFPAFVKHYAFCGLGAQYSLEKAFRFASTFIEFYLYWNSENFKLPEPVYHDPTEKGQLSNRIGKGIADFLAKRLYNARFTHNYEHAMIQAGYSVTGSRPDFYCDTLDSQFALEAKGYSNRSISHNQMLGHKQQSQAGPLPVNFSVASVAYSLYNFPKVKFHDPRNSDIEYNFIINRQLRHIYYSSIMDTIDSFQFRKHKSGINNYDLFEIRWPFPLSVHQMGILVNKNISSRKWNDFTFLEEVVFQDEENYYIDIDGIGIAFKY